MKLLSDFLPVLLFFVSYWLTRDMFLATGIAIAASALLFAFSWLRGQKVELMQWISLGLIVVMGGATLLLHDKHFIMWKPTVLYWGFCLALLVAQLRGRNGIKVLMGKQVTLPEPVWGTLSKAWMGFFLFMGVLNLLVAYQFSEGTWVNFKLFGGTGLMLGFVILQSLFLAKYVEERK